MDRMSSSVIPLREHKTKNLSNYANFYIPSYNEDFGYKTVVRDNSLRIGTSSGNRRNNPHPSHAFMVWRYPNKFRTNVSMDRLSSPIPTINLVCPNDRIMSTYQQDYPTPGNHEAMDSGLPQSPTARPSAKLESTHMWSFQTPKYSKRLQGNTTRYGCNMERSKHVHGVVPTLSAKECEIYQPNDTSYASFFTSPNKAPENSFKLPQLKPGSSLTGIVEEKQAEAINNTKWLSN